MGKLIDKLRQVGQGGGGSFGFFARGQSANAPARPAAVFVRIAASDVAAAEAAGKAGADVAIVTDWKPGADVSSIKAALESASVVWGVEYSGGADDDVAQAAQKTGAGFLILGERAPATHVYDKPEQFDRVVTLTAPSSELDILLYRMSNVLPAQAGLVTLPIGVSELSHVSIAEFTRISLLAASVRFPLLVAVDTAPDLKAARALVRLGFDGIVLSGLSADKIGKQVPALRADLEKIPLSEAQDTEGVSLGGLMGNLGTGVQPERREPDKEPEQE